MLKLPESYAIAAPLDKALAGRTITDVIVEQSPHKFAFFSDYKQKYAETSKTHFLVQNDHFLIKNAIF